MCDTWVMLESVAKDGFFLAFMVGMIVTYFFETNTLSNKKRDLHIKLKRRDVGFVGKED